MSWLLGSIARPGTPASGMMSPGVFGS
jgi:hypothetical protein